MPECQHCGAFIRYGRNASHDPHECCGSSSQSLVRYDVDAMEQRVQSARQLEADIRQVVAECVELMADGWEASTALHIAAKKIESMGFQRGWKAGHRYGVLESKPKPWINDEPVSTERAEQ